MSLRIVRIVMSLQITYDQLNEHEKIGTKMKRHHTINLRLEKCNLLFNISLGAMVVGLCLWFRLYYFRFIFSLFTFIDFFLSDLVGGHNEGTRLLQ